MKLLKLTLISFLLPCVAFAQSYGAGFSLPILEHSYEEPMSKDKEASRLGALQLVVSGGAGGGSFLYRRDMKLNPNYEKKYLHHFRGGMSDAKSNFTMSKVRKITPEIAPLMETRIQHAILVPDEHLGPKIKWINKRFGEGENKKAIAYLENIVANEAKSPGTNVVSSVIVFEKVAHKTLNKVLKYIVEPASVLSSAYGLGTVIYYGERERNSNSAAIFQGKGKSLAEATRMPATKTKNRASAQ